MATTATGAGPALVCYDGSTEAEHALAAALDLLGQREIVVVTVWQSLQTQLAENGSIAVATDVDGADDDDRDAKEHAAAHDLVLAAAAHARAAAHEVTTRADQARGPVWQTLIDVADEADASVIVTGTRGRGAVASAVLGSVSRELIAHSHRPVLVVPQPA